MEIPQKVLEIVEDTVRELVGKHDTPQNASDVVKLVGDRAVHESSKVVDEVINRLVNSIELTSVPAAPELTEFVRSLIGDVLAGKSPTLQPESILSGLVSLVLNRASQLINLDLGGISLQEVLTTVLNGIQQDAARRAAMQRIADQVDQEINSFLRDRPKPHINLFHNEGKIIDTEKP